MPCSLTNTVGWRNAAAPVPVAVACSVAMQVGWLDGGTQTTLCANHYVALAYRIRHAPNNPAQTAPFADIGLLEDYMRLYLLMLNQAAVLQQLEALSRSFGGRAREAVSTSNYARLSSKLTSFERRCWFPETHLVALGILPVNTFITMLRSGYMLKDVGAGANHGEFSHRLQWHAVMRVMTADFTAGMAAGWNHSPFELFTLLGEGDGLQRGLWGTLFDNQGGPGFTDPSALDASIRTGALGFLSRQITAIRQKRADITARSMAAANAAVLAPHPGVTNAVVYAQTQAAELERTYLRAKGYVAPAVALPGGALLRELAGNDELTAANGMNHVQRVLGIRRQYVMETINGGQVLKLDGDALVNPLAIPARRVISRGPLRPRA